MADEELPDRSGSLLADRYRLTKRLGAGGMGEVYRATNEKVHREVAIKVLKPEYARSPDVVQRVLREARAANAVHHPNVVDVIDVDTDAQGAPIIVQELLTGEDLSQHLRARGVAFTEREVLDVMIPVCEAVGAAHRAGIMHRDLKLENVFLHRPTHGAVVPKVLDFGLSRHIGEDAVSRLTATGVAMGTPMYMSPEQVQGERNIDQRTDVWALGVMLYELTAGRLPFGGESLGAIFVKICTIDPDPLRPIAPQVSDGYATIVGRCLRRDRDARYPSAAELAADLQRLRQGAVTLDENAPAAPGILAAARPGTPIAASQNFGGVGSAATLASAPALIQPPAVDARPSSSRSIGPAVSQVHPAPRRMGLIAAGALAACAIVGGGVWAATRRSDPPVPAAPARPAPPAPAAMLAPAAPVVPAPPAPPAPTPPAEVAPAAAPSAREDRGRRRRDEASPADRSAAAPAGRTRRRRPERQPRPGGDRLPGGGTTSFEE